MKPVRPLAEGIARKTTSRRGFFGRGLDIAFGALAGAAAGTVTRARDAGAGFGTVCGFPGPPCPCSGCRASGLCAKPCQIHTQWYAGGCWVTVSTTCCDCHCHGYEGANTCGCGSDYHNNTNYCPDGNADS